ncbi:MAG: alpha-glucan family phosphorylase [Fimbriiglobus sp.]|jgi:starch phosphorylase|nr:alpha-glucan family phosphorylase [Fimbriiglobus sp.]
MPARPVRTFTVLPNIPDRLKALQDLAYNLWWCWHADAVALFRRIDQDLFDRLDHSPVRLGYAVSQARLDELAHDDGFLAHLDRVSAAFRAYQTGQTWFGQNHPEAKNLKVAYFSMEFGIHESVPVYSGGLGVLAGDHLKSASDLGIPLVGVSMMYREGYFRQYLNSDGWQQERYPENDFFSLPLIAEVDGKGDPILVGVELPGREVKLRIWRIQVGRVPLYLLDANIPQNRPEDRAITSQLYGGDIVTRIQQEIVLGIGGVRALRAVGHEPTVCHLNEGHAAFCALERVRTLMAEKKLDFATAAEAIKAGTVFTTHTPVPAGNDVFDPGLMDQYFGGYYPQLGLDRRSFLALGRQHAHDEGERFGMTVLAIRMSNTSNGVSKLHGHVSRNMWNPIWPTLPDAEVPITSVTNGVHTQSWLAGEFGELFERYMGVKWDSRPVDFAVWKQVEQIPDGELWRTHEKCRARLIRFARNRLKEQLIRRGAPAYEVAAAAEVLDPEALTIGFARRFATYKRGDLVFRDSPRLAALLNNPGRPVQFIFAGKAHPKDNGGKELIARVVQNARLPDFRNRVVFIEDYDMNVARHLVHGVDVWLNNPRRPLEASGTSGMKVAVNGGLNMSILDGWWVEGYDGENGFAIGSGEEYSDLKYQDDVESRLIYELVERELVPLFYDRGPDGLPRQWIRRMKKAISTLVPAFNTNRMVEEYLERCYLPAHGREATLTADGLRPAGELAGWRRKVQSAWGGVRVDSVEAPTGEMWQVGKSFPVNVRVQLGGIAPTEVEVQVCYGHLDAAGEVTDPKVVALAPDGSSGGSGVLFTGQVPCKSSGQFGFSVRVLPKHPNLPNLFEPGLVTWG